MIKITPNSLKKYLDFLKSEYSSSSFNRKLSSLRRFIAFLEEKKRIDKEKGRQLQRVLNPKSARMQRIVTNKTDKKLLDANSASSTSRVINHNTTNIGIVLIIFLLFSTNILFLGKIKSQILSKISPNSNLEQTLGSSVNSLKAVKLPLSAILTDNYNIPLSYQQEVSFSIYSSENSPDPIYSTGRCAVLPDNDGKIKITIGQDCGRPVPYNIFQENLELYLGVSLGFGSELLPRTPIKRLNIVLQRPTAPPISPTIFFIDKNQESTPSNTID